MRSSPGVWFRSREGRRLFAYMTVLENLELGGYPAAARREIAANLASVFDLFPILKERQDQLGGTLSGGEQQMLAIGRGLMSRPRLLMLDEPSLGLAPRVVEQVFEIIKEIHSRGISVLLVEQDVFRAWRSPTSPTFWKTAGSCCRARRRRY